VRCYKPKGNGCPIPLCGAGRYKVKNNGNAKDARLKNRRPLPFDPALRDLRVDCAAAQFTSSAPTAVRKAG
jgi:hypothetical protein